MLNKYISIYLQNRPAFFSLIRPQEADLFEQNKNIIKPPILDLGCGDGFFAEAVWGKNKIDIGLDLPNERTINIEKSKIYKKIVYFDGIKIPYQDNFFQTIVSNCVLEHVENLEGLLKEVIRVLRPGGYFLTGVMCDKWENYFFWSKLIGKNYIKFMRKKQDHKNLFSSEKWHQEFENAGFKVGKETGYLSKSTSLWMDIFHYLSFPELISYKLFNRWVLFPRLVKTLKFEKIIEKIIIYPEKIEDSAAVFFVSKKSV